MRPASPEGSVGNYGGAQGLYTHAIQSPSDLLSVELTGRLGDLKKKLFVNMETTFNIILVTLMFAAIAIEHITRRLLHSKNTYIANTSQKKQDGYLLLFGISGCSIASYILFFYNPHMGVVTLMATVPTSMKALRNIRDIRASR
jgi:hypothetical protein